MFSLWKFFIHKRAFTGALIVALCFFGVAAMFSIPKESAPEVRIAMAIVTTVIPGATAEDAEKLVTNKLESGLSTLENVDTITSRSREGISSVVVQFLPNADIDKSIRATKDEVERLRGELPEDAKDPVVTEVNFSDQPILILSVTTDVPPSQLPSLADALKDQLRGVVGVSKVNVSGVRDREVSIVVDKGKLAQYGLRLTDISQAISTANASLPVGNLVIDTISYEIKFRGDITDPETIGNIALLPGNAGQPIYVRDIAFVSNGVANPTSYSRVSVHGSPSEQAITLYVFKSAGGDVTKTGNAVKKKIEELKGGILAGSNTVISFDRADLVERDLKRLTEVGFETVALVVISLLLTIGWREAIVAAISIPLSFLIAFIGLLYSGNTINFLSLFSLILAIGVLVDSGIVVTEAINARTKLYPTKKEAAYASLREYGWPLIAGTVTSVAAFVPLFFISGIVGKFVASIPFTIIFVLVASLFVALGFVPLIAILFTKTEKNRFELLQDEYTEKVKSWYKQKLALVLDNRRFQNMFLWGLGIAFIASLMLPITGLLKVIFFTQDNVDFIYAEIEKPQGSVLGQTDLAAREAEEILYRDPRVDSFVTTIGETSSFSQEPNSSAKFANITILLKKDRTETSTEVKESLRKEFATLTGATFRVEEPNNGPPSGAPVLIKFTGDSLDDLDKTADIAENILSKIDGTLDVVSSTKDNGTELELTIDTGKATELGLSPLVVAQTLRGSVAGITATKIKGGSKDIDVVVKTNLNTEYTDTETTNYATVDALRNISIETPRGPVLLGSVVDISLARAQSVISHEDKKRIVTVSSFVAPHKTAAEISAAFDKEISKVNLPEGVSIKVGGENEDVNKSFRDMFLSLIGGLILMLMILVLEFNSFRFPVFLLVTIPLSLIGVLSGLTITRQTLSFPSLLGFIALSGVIINHSIILLDSMIHMLRNHPEMPLKQAVVESAAVRLRPIFLTTITTVVGVIPLTNASALWGPLAYAIMFGLSFAIVLTLILVPILFFRWPGNLDHLREE